MSALALVFIHTQIEFHGMSDTAAFISSAMTENGALCIARTESDGHDSEVTWLSETDHNDYKPVISPDGAKIAFFRTYQEDPSFFLWRSSICVMDIDGSNFHEITDHTHMNTEPYWTRDGSDRVTWSRMVHPDNGKQGTYAFWSKHDADPGREQCLSDSNREWINSSLADGRIFVKVGENYFLMKPNPEGSSIHEPIDYPDEYHYLHKLTISNDETMIAYMKHVDRDHDEYSGAEIVYAPFDANQPAIGKETAFSPLNPQTFSWYVSISADNDRLIFAEDGKMLEYDVRNHSTRQLSTRPGIHYRYPVYVGSIK